MLKFQASQTVKNCHMIKSDWLLKGYKNVIIKQLEILGRIEEQCMELLYNDGHSME